MRFPHLPHMRMALSLLLRQMASKDSEASVLMLDPVEKVRRPIFVHNLCVCSSYCHNVQGMVEAHLSEYGILAHILFMIKSCLILFGEETGEQEIHDRKEEIGSIE